MSCSTLNNQVGLNVATANLPEGFCPSSMQELLQAFGARLIVTPNQSFNGFAIGSIEPASNVGPWFKDCLELFVFDDATARYVPMQIPGGFRTMVYETVSGTFTVPDFIYQIRVTAWGAGGGGFYDGANFNGGGGGGGRGVKIFAVTPGQMISFNVGIGGATGNPATNGGATTFLTMSAGGGNAGILNYGVTGGIVTGADFGVTGGTSGQAPASGAPGHGGLSPGGGSGGEFATGGSVVTGVVPGGGGSGGYTASTGGNGANGAILIEF